MSTQSNRFVYLSTAMSSIGVFLSSSALATTLTVANPSFENPAVNDGVTTGNPTYVAQGGYGWSFDSTISGIANPGANEYATAGENGTPLGADGAHVGIASRVNGGGELDQLLAGPDGIVGNGDDPVVTPTTLYTLTVIVGHAAANRPSYIGYDIQLFARNGNQDAVIGEVIFDGFPAVPSFGNFKDVTLTLDTLSIPSFFYGQSLGIRLLSPTTHDLTSTTTYDNVRLTAVSVPESCSLILFTAGAVGCLVGLRRVAFFGRV